MLVSLRSPVSRSCDREMGFVSLHWVRQQRLQEGERCPSSNKGDEKSPKLPFSLC